MIFVCVLLLNIQLFRCQTCQVYKIIVVFIYYYSFLIDHNQETWSDFVVQQSGKQYLKVDTATNRVTVNDALFVGSQDVGALLSQLQTQVNQLKTDLTAANAQITALKAAPVAPSQSSTFIHYGLQTCPSPSTLVYSGQLISGHISHSGATVNYLCLPSTGLFSTQSFISPHSLSKTL